MIRATGDLRTLWFMGAKTRIIPEFIEGAVADLLDDGKTLLDLCSGTGIVARSLAHRYRVLTNDTLRFCATVASAHLECDADWLDAIEKLDAGADLDRVFLNNQRTLSRLLPAALAREAELLPAVVAELSGGPAGEAARAYRQFTEATPTPAEPGNSAGPLYAPYKDLYQGLWTERSRDPGKLPFALATLYYPNLYFGLRQAVVIDSLRAAIDQLAASDPFRERKRALYLAALLYAASISTSGTSHFAQPRSLDKDSELLAVAKRRSIDIELEFHRALDSIRREWGERERHAENRVFCQSAESLLAPDGPLVDQNVGLVYFDPPYTSDNHSRFYHVLETLVAYDYPPLEERGGTITRGRYSTKEHRFQSDFCKPREVENAFRTVAERCHALGARLLVSYSDIGLLLKQWAKSGESEPRRRFHALFKDYYPHVEVRDCELMHSGQGDTNLRVKELLVLCEA